MSHFNFNMRAYGAATQPLTLEDVSQYFRKSYDNRLLIKASPYGQDFYDLQIIVENLSYLETKSNNAGVHAHLQGTIETMAEALNLLAEENEKLKQRLDEVEMFSRDN
jgi:hypothetical protein